MNFMEWVRSVAAKHEDLRDAIVSPDGQWLDVLLPDGRTFRFRPAQLVDPDTPEAERTERLNRLFSIGVKNAQAPEHNLVTETDPHDATVTSTRETGTPETHNFNPANTQKKSFDLRSVFNLEVPQHLGAIDGEGKPLMLPIVRRADYFLRSHNRKTGDSIVYIPLTDFVAVALAKDHAERIDALFFSHFEHQGIDANVEGHSLFNQAIHNLRGYNLSGGKTGVVIGVTRVAGAQVLTFTSPEDYQSSWFADVEIIQQVKDSIVHDNPEALPLFIPASRTNLLVVFADDPYLSAFFSLIRRNISAPDTIYPLPHTIAEDGWREWIPLPDHPAAGVLEKLRNECRAQVYATQAEFLRQSHNEGKSYGSVKDYEVRELHSGRSVSVATWTGDDMFGSLPLTDFITFVRENADGNNTDGKGAGGGREQVTIRRLVACEVWGQGLKDAQGIWPARLEVLGFPDADTMDALRKAASTRTL